MQAAEAKAKTRKEAIQKALDELGVELHEVQIEILDEGSRGIFGIGARDVAVRITAEGLPDRPAPQEPRAQEESPRRKERGKGRSRQKNRRENREETRNSNGDKKGGRNKNRQENRGRDRGNNREKPSRRERKETPVSDAAANEAAALMGEMIGHMGIEATVTTGRGEAGDLRLVIESPDSALLIGRKGRNLTALQYLINRMAFSPAESGESQERLVVDIEGYQDRRRASLEDMARGLAARAKESGREMRVKPLSAQERRIVHLALEDDPEVRTQSLGNTPLRTIVIIPVDADGNDRPRRSRAGGPRRRSGGSRGGRDRRYQRSRERSQERE